MTLEQLAETENRNPALECAIIEADDDQYMRNSKGGLDLLSMVKPVAILEDDTVRKMFGFAYELHTQIARFRQYCYEDLQAYMEILAEEYGASVGGEKGNITLSTYDNCMKIKVQVAEKLSFRSELQIAKRLVDECMNEWAKEGRDEIRTIITNVFNTEKEGKINRSEVFKLLRYNITDERWLRGMDAIRDAIKVDGTKEYVRFYFRENVKAGWVTISIDLAKAG